MGNPSQLATYSALTPILRLSGRQMLGGVLNFSKLRKRLFHRRAGKVADWPVKSLFFTTWMSATWGKKSGGVAKSIRRVCLFRPRLAVCGTVAHSPLLPYAVRV